MEKKPVHPLVSAGTPRRARLPLHRARRWRADGEDGHKALLPVFVTQPVFRAINSHANSDLDNEVGGWLAGRWCRDIDTEAEFLVVEALLPAQQVRSGSTFLTFTHDSQVAMLAALEERYATKGIVGWYHTHPRMGLFLSGYDTWLHEHFFPHPFQVALVVEPHSHTGGFFIRNGKHELDARRYFGFYELLSRGAESIVDWRNLQGEPQPAPEQEAKPESVDPEANETKVAVVAKSEPANTETPLKVDSRPATEKPIVNPIANTSETQPVQVNRVVAVRKETPKADPAKAEHGVLKKFEGPKPPAKVSLQKNPEKPNGEGKSSQEA
jgi:proteasome lid subunit RPN8/RPN11